MKKKLGEIVGWGFVGLFVLGMIWAFFDKKNGPVRAKDCLKKIAVGQIYAVNPVGNPGSQAIYEYQKIEGMNGKTLTIRRSRIASSTQKTSYELQDPKTFLETTDTVSRDKFSKQQFLNATCE